MSKNDWALVVLFGIIFNALIGLLLYVGQMSGERDGIRSMQIQAIERGYAVYHRGAFVWRDGLR